MATAILTQWKQMLAFALCANYNCHKKQALALVSFEC